MTVATVTPVDAGCWIDGHWGQYGVTRLVEIAQGFGFELDGLERQSTANYLSDEYTDGDAAEIVYGAADKAEAYLNEHVAPEGYSFGWYEGEFYLWLVEAWEDV